MHRKVIGIIFFFMRIQSSLANCICKFFKFIEIGVVIKIVISE